MLRGTSDQATNQLYTEKEKYLPIRYKDHLMDELILSLQAIYLSEYMSKFDELMVQCLVNQEPRQTLSRYPNGLRPKN